MAAQGLSCGMWDLVPQPGIKPRGPALSDQSLGHWTTSGVPHVSFWVRVLCRYIPGVGLRHHMATLILVLWGTSKLFSIVAAQTYVPTTSAEGFPFLYTLSSICCLWIFLWWAFWLVWGGTSLWFWSAFLCLLAMGSIFSRACRSPSEKCLFRSSAEFSIGLLIVLLLSYVSCCLFWKSSCVASFANIFSQAVGCLFVLFMVSFAV